MDTPLQRRIRKKKQQKEFIETIFSQQAILTEWIQSTVDFQTHTILRERLFDKEEEFLASCSSLLSECEDSTGERHDYCVALFMLLQHVCVKEIPHFLSKVRSTHPQDNGMVRDFAQLIGAEESYRLASLAVELPDVFPEVFVPNRFTV